MALPRVSRSCLIVALALAFPLAASSGCTAEAARGGEFEGITWVADTYSDGGTMSKLPEEVAADARFDADRVSGTVLNGYSGPFAATDDGTVTDVGPLVTMKMAGPPPVMAFETAYLTALEKTRSYYSDGSTLTLYDADGEELLTYKKSDTTLIGEWRITAYNNGQQAVVSVISTSTITAVFADGGTLSGNSGVNSYNGSYTTQGSDGISIGELNSTLMAGPQDLMDQEVAYLAALKSATKYTFSGQRLEMRTAEDALAIQAEKAQ